MSINFFPPCQVHCRKLDFFLLCKLLTFKNNGNLIAIVDTLLVKHANMNAKNVPVKYTVIDPLLIRVFAVLPDVPKFSSDNKPI